MPYLSSVIKLIEQRLQIIEFVSESLSSELQELSIQCIDDILDLLNIFDNKINVQVISLEDCSDEME